MTAYEPSEWTDFFVAAAGASAALAGLVFVAVSINIDRILAMEGVPNRALETVLALLGVVMVSLLMLMPEVSREVLAPALLVVVGVLTAIAMQITRLHPAPPAQGPHLSHKVLRVIALLPFAIGAISIAAESGGGIYWIAAGVIVATMAAVMNAWVLLVEILR